MSDDPDGPASAPWAVASTSAPRPELNVGVGFGSVLFDDGEPAVELEREPPGCFADLNLDQVVAAITAGREEYDLRPFFYTPLTTVEAVEYRQATFRDLENDELYSHIASFARAMGEMRKRLALVEKLHYHYEKQAWFLDAIAIYCGAVTGLARDLGLADARSRGLRAFHEFLSRLVESDRFAALVAETRELEQRLAEVRYCVNIKGNRVTVSRYESEADHSAEVERTFEKFKRGAVKDYRAGFPSSAGMNHVEADVLY